MNIITSFFSLIFSLLLTGIILFLIRKLVLWYWKVNEVVNNLEKLYELQLLLHLDEVKEKKITLLNKSSQKKVQMSIKDYLEKEDKDKFSIH